MRVMVVGASTNREKFGNKAVRAYVRQGHEVLPVNPRADDIEDLKCYSKIADPPGPIDRATVYLPPKIGVEAVRAIAERGDVGEVWLNPGADGPEVVKEAEKLGLKTIQACSIVDIGERP
ncbi:MAG: CoA-binding protein [Phycisphaeraceae bacterium]|nr:MAG: CoA-binding protein [Phycisphaeraceae bacterium]